jgi:hypothetical protein
MDRSPIEVKVNLLEKGKDALVLTGNKTKILGLIGIDTALGEKVVVEGSWSSTDNIQVHIRSALVKSSKAKSMARKLIEEEPFFVWLPAYDQYEDDYNHFKKDKKGYIPWTVCPSAEGRLDKDDPLGSIYAETRPRLAENIIKTFSLETDDPFYRIWNDTSGKPMAYSEAWSCGNKYEDEESYSGVRLICSEDLLRDMLTKYNSDLLILVKLQRYEKGISGGDSKFSNTVAVVRIKNTLKFEFYIGAVNKIQEARY